MYIRKEILSAIILSAGIIILTALAVLYCFTEVQIPSWCYGAGWFGCLFGMVSCEKKIEG